MDHNRHHGHDDSHNAVHWHFVMPAEPLVFPPNFWYSPRVGLIATCGQANRVARQSSSTTEERYARRLTIDRSRSARRQRTRWPIFAHIVTTVITKSAQLLPGYPPDCHGRRIAGQNCNSEFTFQVRTWRVNSRKPRSDSRRRTSTGCRGLNSQRTSCCVIFAQRPRIARALALRSPSVLSLKFGEEIIVTNAQLSAKTYVANL